MIGQYMIGEEPPLLPVDVHRLMQGIETATIGHIEYLGFLDSSIRPVRPAVASGRAITVAAPGRDGAVIYKAIDLVRPGDVLVIARVDQDDIACVGGGVATAAKARGAAAIVVDGPCTDTDEIAEIGLPVWCRGVSARTTNRQCCVGGSVNIPVACGGAVVLPGYAVLADPSGIFITDPARMAALCEEAHARQARSQLLRPHLAAGKSIFDFKQEARDEGVASSNEFTT